VARMCDDERAMMRKRGEADGEKIFSVEVAL